MSPPVTRTTVAGRTYLDLQNLARRHKRPTQEYLQLYVLEGFLARLSTSSRASSFVLKGGVLLAAYDVRRPTADVDFAGRDLSNDMSIVHDLIVEVVGGKLDDGIVFDTSNAVAEVIRDEDVYSGVRVILQAQVASARLGFHVDVNVGDPIMPAPVTVQLPRLLGGELTLRGYPLSMVIAEKVVTALERGTANTRWRDFADIYLLTDRHRLLGDEVQASLATVAAFRDVRLRRTFDVLGGYAEIGQKRWTQWRGKHHLDGLVPSSFGELVDRVTDFSDPAIEQTVTGLVWEPDLRTWTTIESP